MGRMATGHEHGGGGARRLSAALLVSLVSLAAVATGGLLSGSLALLADAAHQLADVLALTLGLGAALLARRPPSARRTFGWERAEVLSAGGNALLLLVVTAWIAVEAVGRLADPQPVHAPLMLATAAFGLLANTLSLRFLHGGHQHSFAVRGAYLEVLADLLGSAAAAAAALVIWFGGPVRADSVASLLIAALMAPRALLLLGAAGHVLLEGAPRGLDLGHVRDHILGVPGVLEVHDLHAWTITSGRPILTAHVVVADQSILTDCGASVLDRLGECLDHHFDVAHSTFQLEPATHQAHERRLH
jgi:cation diffusion facilitator family transporter